MRTPLALALLLAAAAPRPAAAQESATLTVQVVDQQSGAPIPNATVEVAGVRQRGRTNGDGVWRGSRLPVGNRIVQVTRIGYAPARAAVELTAGADQTQTIPMAESSVEVEGVAASGERRSVALENRGFYERQRRGHGAFMTYETIERLRPMRTVELFYHIRGFMVKRDRMGQPYLSTARGGASLDPECAAPVIFLDGNLLSNGNRFNSRGSGPLESINPESIAAIEAYAGPASVPEEYRVSGGACGTVLIWTRAGDEPVTGS